uniref:Uncharacterized protein n=1 Tax=Arundo donax TaxID=35708 RepID=A0A0A9AWV4_ARUDO
MRQPEQRADALHSLPAGTNPTYQASVILCCAASACLLVRLFAVRPSMISG